MTWTQCLSAAVSSAIGEVGQGRGIGTDHLTEPMASWAGTMLRAALVKDKPSPMLAAEEVKDCYRILGVGGGVRCK
jgi:hypothetical protein